MIFIRVSILQFGEEIFSKKKKLDVHLGGRGRNHVA